MRVALVTGAAGGLGRELVAGLERDGWAVAASDLPGTGMPFDADLRDGEACGHLVERVIAEHSRLDLLVNNAATMYHGLLDLADLDRWWDTISVNLSAPFRLARRRICRAASDRRPDHQRGVHHGVQRRPGLQRLLRQ